MTIQNKSWENVLNWCGYLPEKAVLLYYAESWRHNPTTRKNISVTSTYPAENQQKNLLQKLLHDRHFGGSYNNETISIFLCCYVYYFVYLLPLYTFTFFFVSPVVICTNNINFFQYTKESSLFFVYCILNLTNSSWYAKVCTTLLYVFSSFCYKSKHSHTYPAIWQW